MSQYLPYCIGFIFGGYMKSLLFGCPVTANVFFELELKNRQLSNNSDSSNQPNQSEQSNNVSQPQTSSQVLNKSPHKSKIYRIYLTLVPEIIGAIALGLLGSRFLECLTGKADSPP